MTAKNRTHSIPDVQASPPSREFIARLKLPVAPWMTYYTDAEVKDQLRRAVVETARDRVRLCAAELARRNTLYALERQYGYAALAGRAVAS